MAYRSTERTEARLAEARERITEAARELIAEGGYVAAQIAAVADRAGVAVGTVYRHFLSKSELFAAVFRDASQREVDAMRSAMEVDARAGESADERARVSATRLETTPVAAERVAAGIEVFARRALRGKRLAWALLAEPVDPAVEAERLHFRRSYRDLMAEVIRDGIEAGEVPPQDADATAAALIGAIGETMLGPLSPTHSYSGSFQHQTGRSSRSALALRPRTTDPEALIASLITFCRRAIGEEHARVHA